MTNKIRKTQNPFISEAHDNFRKPSKIVGENSGTNKTEFLFNYFDQTEIDLRKKRAFK